MAQDPSSSCNAPSVSANCKASVSSTTGGNPASRVGAGALLSGITSCSQSATSAISSRISFSSATKLLRSMPSSPTRTSARSFASGLRYLILAPVVCRSAAQTASASPGRPSASAGPRGPGSEPKKASAA
eukprot:CAMPEP_0175483934 /NCGR_PEP_ID=MMETSP0095-20121207/79734_1 /TAXON_ID=311494 /ORGANISM="Alexandrium monilatum, Strain CCMP3105" /LENGTH=129 /DNA_ID=CAMNT_0016785639 /DNA_START=87 /DNA_END=473 /DNA_ORIENTATION=-